MDFPHEPCPSCGAQLGGRAGCDLVFQQLSAAAWTNPGAAAVHNLVVDAYAMQHPEEYGRSAKSYFQHLTGLCCAMERPGDADIYWRIAPSFSRVPVPAKPPLLADRGSVTIADVYTVSPPEYAQAVRHWAATVWAVYGSQHQLARERLAIAVRARNAGKR